jgi:hypothetical protein
MEEKGDRFLMEGRGDRWFVGGEGAIVGLE